MESMESEVFWTLFDRDHRFEYIELGVERCGSGSGCLLT
jgi:hypothetical protein